MRLLCVFGSIYWNLCGRQCLNFCVTWRISRFCFHSLLLSGDKFCQKRHHLLPPKTKTTSTFPWLHNSSAKSRMINQLHDRVCIIENRRQLLLCSNYSLWLVRSFVFFLLVKLTKLTGSQYTSCDAAHARN